MYDLAIKHGSVYLGDQLVETNLYIKDGKFKAIGKATFDALKTIDAKGKFVFPGIIDPHVHFELDLGFITSRDDMYHGSKAALFGGVTTVIDFLEPVSDIDGLVQAFEHRNTQAQAMQCDYQFHATIKAPTCDLEKFVLTMKDLGMNTLKCFTTYSESGRQTKHDDIKTLLELTKKHDFMLVVHVEDDAQINIKPHYLSHDLPKARPEQAEIDEALKMAAMVAETGGKLYMVHVSSGHTLQALKTHYPTLLNQRFFIETCPQYMMFTEEKLTTHHGDLYACAPPLRSEAAQATLKSLFSDIETFATDHCAFHKNDKTGKSLSNMPMGIGSVEQAFPVLFSLFGLAVLPKMTTNVAERFGMKQKGAIKINHDADCFIFNPKPQHLNSHHGYADYNLYQGLEVKGNVETTLLRGMIRVHQETYKEGRGHHHYAKTTRTH